MKKAGGESEKKLGERVKKAGGESEKSWGRKWKQAGSWRKKPEAGRGNRARSKARELH